MFRVLGFRLQDVPGFGFGFRVDPQSYFEACRVVRLISNCMSNESKYRFPKSSHQGYTTVIGMA